LQNIYNSYWYEKLYLSTHVILGCLFLVTLHARGADKSLARPDQKKTIERSPFFIRRGSYCCRGDLVGQTFEFILVAYKS